MRMEDNMSNNETINGKTLKRVNGVFGPNFIHPDGGTRSFDWSDVTQAGTFTTYGVRGCRYFVVLTDGALVQVSRSAQKKDDRDRLDRMVGQAVTPRTCPRHTTQVVLMGEPVAPKTVKVVLVNFRLRDVAGAWLHERGYFPTTITSDMVAAEVPAEVGAEFAAAFPGAAVAS